jgi:ABC-2 type transport system ATP-binding protein
MLTTLIEPTSGTAEVAGYDVVRHRRDVRRSIGYVGQGNAAGHMQRGRDEVVSQGRAHGLGRAAAHARADELLEAFDLTEHARRPVSTLSGGQRRRLDVAIGIVGRPELLFLDEPTAGFDPQARREFHQLVQRLSSLEHTTILLTTHDLDEAEKLADRVLILAGGRIVADDTPDGLAQRVAGDAEVRWSVDGQRFVRRTGDPTGFVRNLFAQDGEAVRDLDVRRASLEDAYLSLVQEHEAGHAEAAARLFKEVTR